MIRLIMPWTAYPINGLQTEFLLNNIYKFGSYMIVNTLRLHCEDQLVNDVGGGGDTV
jgi:hypothetical protein